MKAVDRTPTPGGPALQETLELRTRHGGQVSRSCDSVGPNTVESNIYIHQPYLGNPRDFIARWLCDVLNPHSQVRVPNLHTTRAFPGSLILVFAMGYVITPSGGFRNGDLVGVGLVFKRSQ